MSTPTQNTVFTKCLEAFNDMSERGAPRSACVQVVIDAYLKHLPPTPTRDPEVVTLSDSDEVEVGDWAWVWDNPELVVGVQQIHSIDEGIETRYYAQGGGWDCASKTHPLTGEQIYVVPKGTVVTAIVSKKVNDPDDPTTWEKGVRVFTKNMLLSAWTGLGKFHGYESDNCIRVSENTDAWPYWKLATPGEITAWELLNGTTN